MTERIALDVHAHLAPIFPDELRDVAGVEWKPDTKVLVIDGHEVGMTPGRYVERVRVEAARRLLEETSRGIPDIALTCGFGSLVPYVYPVALTALLVHREHRDDRDCREKYGADWAAYCRRVPYRFVPGIY